MLQWVIIYLRYLPPISLSFLLWNLWKLWVCYTISSLDCRLLKIKGFAVCKDEWQDWRSIIIELALEMAQFVIYTHLSNHSYFRDDEVAVQKVMTYHLEPERLFWFWTWPWTTLGCIFSYVIYRTLNRYSEHLRLCFDLFIMIFIVSLCTVFLSFNTVHVWFIIVYWYQHLSLRSVEALFSLKFLYLPNL